MNGSEWIGLEEIDASRWVEKLGHIDENVLVRAVAEAVRDLLIPIWSKAHPENKQPVRALDAALACISRPGNNATRHALAIAKACTKERTRTFGYEHRIAEAARAVVWAATGSSREARLSALAEALAKIEEQLSELDAIDAVYGREPQIRGKIIERLRRVIDLRD